LTTLAGAEQTIREILNFSISASSMAQALQRVKSTKINVSSRDYYKIVQGLFYARSCETARPFVDNMLTNKRLVRASMGSNIYEPFSLAGEDRATPTGARIFSLENGAPA